jgi:ABC-2 type transport system ATP-binding protein
VRLELRQAMGADAFARYGEVEAIEGREVRLLIPRERLTEQVGRLLADLAVVDLSVSDPPIEDIIGRLFRQGALT